MMLQYFTLQWVSLSDILVWIWCSNVFTFLHLVNIHYEIFICRVKIDFLTCLRNWCSLMMNYCCLLANKYFLVVICPILKVGHIIVYFLLSKIIVRKYIKKIKTKQTILNNKILYTNLKIDGHMKQTTVFWFEDSAWCNVCNVWL